MVATNIFGRGIDIERVNIVINYDMPEDDDTFIYSYTVNNAEGENVIQTAEMNRVK